MSGIVALAVAAAVAYAVAQRLRLPAVPVLVLAGVAMTLLPGTPQIDVEQAVPQLALAFLVFSAGLELEPTRVGRHLGVASRVALIQFLVIGAIGVGLVLLLGRSLIESAYVGLGLGASSTIVVVRLLVERRQIFEPFGRLVLGVLLLQDLLMVLVLAALIGLDSGPRGLITSLASVIVLLAFALGLVRPLAPRLLARFDRDPDTLLVVAFAILFAFVGAAWLLGLPPIVGAFLAGLSISIFPVGGMVRAPIASVGTFFAAVFFTALGCSIELPAWRDLSVALVALAAVVLATPVVVTLTARRSRLSRRGMLEAGMLLAQCGEFTLVMAVLGLGLGHLDEGLFSAMSLITVVSMVLTPLLATNDNARRLDRILPRPRLPEIAPLEGHLVLIGCGSNSELLIDLLSLTGSTLVVVDRDAAVVARLEERDVVAVCGEGSDPVILDAVHASRARAIISTMKRPADNAWLLRHLAAEDGPLVIVRVFDDEDAERLTRLGATVVSEAEVGAAEAVLSLREVVRPQSA